MFRHSALTFLCFFFVLGCSAKPKQESPDPLNEALSLPPTKPLSPSETTKAKALWSDMNGVLSGVAQLQPTEGSPKITGATGDTIAANCKVVSDETTRGNHFKIEALSQDISGHTCPISSDAVTEGDSVGNNRSLRVSARFSQSITVVHEPLLSQTRFRSAAFSGGLFIAMTAQDSTTRMRTSSNFAGQAQFQDGVPLQMFSQTRSDLYLSGQAGVVMNGKIKSAYGLAVEGQWYVMLIEANTSNGATQLKCALNGVDISTDPVCSGNAAYYLARSRPAAVSLAYGK